MARRTEIMNAIKDYLTSLNVFKKVYTAATDVSKENSFPIAWIFVDTETFPESTLQKTFRELTVLLRICTKATAGDDQINVVIDKVIEVLEKNYTLGGLCIDLKLKTVDTDGGIMYPYSFGDITFKVLLK